MEKGWREKMGLRVEVRVRRSKEVVMAVPAMIVGGGWVW